MAEPSYNEVDYTETNVKPYDGKYPQPQAPQSFGSQSLDLAPESKDALKKAAPPSGYKHTRFPSERGLMNSTNNQFTNEDLPVTGVVQKQATIGDVLDAYMKGGSPKSIADNLGLDETKVADIIKAADKQGKFIPPGAEVPVDFGDTPRFPDATTPMPEGTNPEAETDTTDTKRGPGRPPKS